MATTKTALITGASGGFGREFAKLFAADGYDVILVSRNGEKLEDIATDLKMKHGIRAIVIEKDLSRTGSADALYNQVKNQNIEVDVLVNNAGVGEHGLLTETDMDKEMAVIHLNVISLYQLTKLFLKDMVARDEGKILQLASTASLAPLPFMSVYSGTKAFVYAFTLALVNELKDTNVSMTALIPGASDTDFFKKAHAEHTMIYNDTKLSDPAKVAKDGYVALMKGKSKVISGTKNKVQAAMANVLPTQSVTKGTRKLMEEKKEDKKEDEK